MRSVILILLTTTLLLSNVKAHADNPTREFVMSCTYGVLAGTLVGTASLAFVKQPNKNMHRVARGASLGLYTGILLGLYVVYIVPSLEDNPDDVHVGSLLKSPIQIAPIFHDRSEHRLASRNSLGIDGIQADWTILKF